MRNKTVRDVMMPEPWTVDAKTSLQDTAHLMRAWDVRDVLVTDDGEMCGVLTDQDIVLFAVASGQDPSLLTAGECTYPEVYTAAAGDSTEKTVAFMRRHGLSRLPVVDGKQLVGSVWIADLAIASQTPADADSTDHLSYA